ncbi:hypothetical protein AB5J72_48955 [Streptomyces sp. CG1]|uniref:hypothetical protein n=1 Tax=Streptomyces sp. CG1 TaxID=1287523 RepID=UPI0034E2FCD8
MADDGLDNAVGSHPVIAGEVSGRAPDGCEADLEVDGQAVAGASPAAAALQRNTGASSVEVEPDRAGTRQALAAPEPHAAQVLAGGGDGRDDGADVLGRPGMLVA